MATNLNKASSGTRVTLRFIVVGIAATATYLVATLLLLSPSLRVEPVLASALASGISTLVSYAGHHSYTFERTGDHGFYFPRFIAVTVSLFLLSTMGMYFFTHVIPTDPSYVAIAITVTYPVASYLLNLLWVFKAL